MDFQVLAIIYLACSMQKVIIDFFLLCKDYYSLERHQEYIIWVLLKVLCL